MKQRRQSQRGKPAEQGGYERRDQIIAEIRARQAEFEARQGGKIHEHVEPQTLKFRERQRKRDKQG